MIPYSKKLLDPQLKKIAVKMPYNLWIVRLGNLFLPLLFWITPIVNGIKEPKFIVPVLENQSVKVYVFTPEKTTSNLPALLYFHGGAFSYKAAPYHKKLAAIYARKAGCKVYLPDYATLPKYKYRHMEKESMTLYRYLIENSKTLGIDSKKIGIAGDSAGGFLAAQLVNNVQKENIPLPCLQMLIYPVIDNKLQTRSMKEFDNTPLWNSRSNRKMWKYFLEGLSEKEKENVSLLNEKKNHVIPNTYIETAQFDCLHDEGILYAQKLKKYGGKVELRKTQSTFHGYDMAVTTKTAEQNIWQRVQFLKENFR